MTKRHCRSNMCVDQAADSSSLNQATALSNTNAFSNTNTGATACHFPDVELGLYQPRPACPSVISNHGADAADLALTGQPANVRPCSRFVPCVCMCM